MLEHHKNVFLLSFLNEILGKWILWHILISAKLYIIKKCGSKCLQSALMLTRKEQELSCIDTEILQYRVILKKKYFCHVLKFTFPYLLGDLILKDKNA